MHHSMTAVTIIASSTGKQSAAQETVHIWKAFQLLLSESMKTRDIHVFSVMLHDLVIQLWRLIWKQLQCAYVSLLCQFIAVVTNLR